MAAAQAALRISIGFILDQVTAGRLGMDFLDGLIVLAVTQANVEPVMREGALQRRYAIYDRPPPEALRRPVSIHAIAQSLGLPYETARRRVRRLARLGVCKITEKGVHVPGVVVRSPIHKRVLLAAYDRIGRLYCRLRAIGILQDLPAPAEPDPDWRRAPPLRAVARLSSEYLLRFVDMVRRQTGDLISGLVWVEILRSNTEHLPDVGTDAEDVRPAGFVEDDRRAPVRIATVARRLGMPQETVRRHVGSLVARGACSWTQKGLIVTPETLASPELSRLMAENLAHLSRFFAALSQLGVVALWDQGAPPATRRRSSN